MSTNLFMCSDGGGSSQIDAGFWALWKREKPYFKIPNDKIAELWSSLSNVVYFARTDGLISEYLSI